MRSALLATGPGVEGASVGAGGGLLSLWLSPTPRPTARAMTAATPQHTATAMMTFFLLAFFVKFSGTASRFDLSCISMAMAKYSAFIKEKPQRRADPNYKISR